MTNKAVHLIVVRNSLEQSDVEHYHTDSLNDAMRQAFTNGIDPKRTRFYQDTIDVEHDITPNGQDDVAGLDKLLATSGTIYVVTYPADPITMAITALVVGVGVAVAMMAMMPDIPTAGEASQPPSANNSLSQRVNRARQGGRICDNYGRRHLVPDLIAKPYSFYVNHDETEFAYMSLGHGYYDIHNIYDGKTDVATINGTTVKVFEPNKSPVSDAPMLQIGNNFTADEASFAHMTVTRYDVVNGQVLAPPDNFITESLSINNAGEITGGNFNFTGQFVAGDSITIDGADKLESGNNLTEGTAPEQVVPVIYNLDGTYTITSVTADKIILNNPGAVNADFAKLISNTDFTKAAELTLSTSSQTLWQGPYYADTSDYDQLVFNVVAPNGIYANYGSNWAAYSVDFEAKVEVMRDGVVISSNTKSFTLDNRTGKKYIGGGYYLGDTYYPEEHIQTTDDEVRRTAAMTYFIADTYRELPTDRLRISFRRTTRTLKTDGGSFVQEIRVKDFFTARKLNAIEQHYDETTLYVKQRATEGAMSLKERKIIVDATRKVRDWQNNDALIPSLRADDIIYDMVTDPYICGLTKDHIDMPQVKAEIDKVIAHFGTELCAQFCYSFDVSNLTGQDHIAIAASAVFCQAYRANNKIRLLFEHPTLLPQIWFNAHNILPGTYQQTGSFGVAKNYDGVKIDYVDPLDDAKVSYHYPPDQSATNPHSMEVKGVRNKVQAHMHAMRVWQKDKHGNDQVTFTGADESNLVIPMMRIGVTNISRADVQYGSVMSIDVVGADIVLTTSNPVQFAPDMPYTIFVQLTNGMTDNIGCRAGADDYSVILDRLPADDISTSFDAVVRGTYELVAKTDTDYASYIVTTKTPGDGISNQITAINYDSRFYAYDTDYKNNLIS